MVQGQENRGSPDFGGGVGYQENDDPPRGHIPKSDRDATQHRGHIPESNRSSPVWSPNYSRTPPEDQIPRGCSLHSMEPLRDWFCKGADMTSPAEYEAALCQLEDNPPDIRQYSGGIKAPPPPVRSTLADPGFGVSNTLATQARSGSQ